MSEDIETLSPTTTNEATARAADDRASAPRRAGSGGAWLIALIALGVGGVALWRAYAIEHGQADAQAAARTELVARIDELSRSVDQRKRDLDSLRARVADADGVNKSVREELLGLGERSRHLEDAVANLAEQRLSGRDALALNEAEFLLQQAQERLALFHDAHTALTAYQLADSALAAAEDPVFASVRQAISAESRALEASKPADTQAALATLERIRESLATLPPPQAATSDTAPSSRWEKFISQFVHISHGNDTTTLADRNIGMTRALSAIDLRAAEAALLARDADGYTAALKRARAGIVAGFDTQTAAAKSALADLDRLAGTPLATAPPELGGALRELRNLRATRALAQPPVAKPLTAPSVAPPAPPATSNHNGVGP
jgi:uroporphyrin-3 C-methyltransferase